MTSIWVNTLPESLPEAHAAFSSLESVFALEGQQITGSSLGHVIYVVLDGIGYYVKRNLARGEGLSAHIGLSKARREWQNLQRMRDWGLEAVQPVAYGEESYWSRTRRGVVITREVTNTKDLSQLAKQTPEIFKDHRWLEPVMQQVAYATRIMHEHRFAHNDWKWRNILVQNPQENAKIYLIDCPAGMFWFGLFFERRRIKDVACLDKVGKQVMSNSRRLRFYLLYRGHPRLTDKDKRDIRRIVHYFREDD